MGRQENAQSDAAARDGFDGFFYCPSSLRRVSQYTAAVPSQVMEWAIHSVENETLWFG